MGFDALKTWMGYVGYVMWSREVSRQPIFKALGVATSGSTVVNAVGEKGL